MKSKRSPPPGTGAAAIQERIARGLPAYRTLTQTAVENPTSRAAAINAKCYDCQGGDHADPGWQWAIGNCEVDCPLIPFRPYQKKKGKAPEGVYRTKSDERNKRAD